MACAVILKFHRTTCQFKVNIEFHGSSITEQTNPGIREISGDFFFWEDILIYLAVFRDKWNYLLPKPRFAFLFKFSLENAVRTIKNHLSWKFFFPHSRLPFKPPTTQKSLHILRGEAQAGHGHCSARRHRRRVRRWDWAAQAAHEAPKLQPDPWGLWPHQWRIQLFSGQAHVWVAQGLVFFFCRGFLLVLGQEEKEMEGDGSWTQLSKFPSLYGPSGEKKSHLGRVTIRLNPILGVHHLDLVGSWAEFSVSQFPELWDCLRNCVQRVTPEFLSRGALNLVFNVLFWWNIKQIHGARAN